MKAAKAMRQDEDLVTGIAVLMVSCRELLTLNFTIVFSVARVRILFYIRSIATSPGPGGPLPARSGPSSHAGRCPFSDEMRTHSARGEHFRVCPETDMRRSAGTSLDAQPIHKLGG